MAYDSPDRALRYIDAGHLTGAASASMRKFPQYRAALLKRAQATIITAGTHASAAFDIYSGTTSVGSLAVGTNTAGVTVSSGTINAQIAADSYIEVKGKADSATCVAAIQFEVQTND